MAWTTREVIMTGLHQEDERHHGTNSKSAEAQASSVETKSYLSKWK